MRTTGYSGTPLAKKLGIKSDFKIQLINQPSYYLDLFTNLPSNIKILNDKTVKKNLIHYFAKNAKQLTKDIQQLKKEIEQDGIIWISWPKKTSKMQTDVTEHLVRDLGLANNLVDIKICAIDEIWSALKFVIPVKDRKA